MTSLADSNNICKPRVAMTDANTTIPCEILHPENAHI